jgi:hypothetical protein
VRALTLLFLLEALDLLRTYRRLLLNTTSIGFMNPLPSKDAIPIV